MIKTPSFAEEWDCALRNIRFVGEPTPTMVEEIKRVFCCGMSSGIAVMMELLAADNFPPPSMEVALALEELKREMALEMKVHAVATPMQ